MSPQGVFMNTNHFHTTYSGPQFGFNDSIRIHFRNKSFDSFTRRLWSYTLSNWQIENPRFPGPYWDQGGDEMIFFQTNIFILLTEKCASFRELRRVFYIPWRAFIQGRPGLSYRANSWSIGDLSQPSRASKTSHYLAAADWDHLSLQATYGPNRL